MSDSLVSLIIKNSDSASDSTSTSAKQSVKLADVQLITSQKNQNSQKQKELIWKEAKENREFYLKKKRESNSGLPWFRHIKKETQYSEFVLLSPEMAQVILDNMWQEADGNRRMKEWLKDNYKRDILNENWIPSDESIGIDYDGVPYNGRHRMTALVESGCEYPFYITFNALKEAKFTVDSGAKRSPSEKLKLIVDTTLGNRTVSFCKAVMRGLGTRLRPTETEIAEFAHKWEPMLDWVSKNIPKQRAEVQAAIAKSYLWYGPELIEPFCERLTTLTFVEDGDPARALYIALQRHKLNRMNTDLVCYTKTLNSIHALIANKGVSRLYERKVEDIFEWQPNWELPNGSWWANKQS